MKKTNTTVSGRIGALIALGAASFGALAEPETAPARHEFSSLDGNFVAEAVLDGLSEPAAITFLPDGRVLVLQRDRGLVTLADFSTGAKTDIAGLPDVHVVGSAGVHDLELHPDYAENGWVYISYSEGEEFHSTVVLDRFSLNSSFSSSGFPC